MKKPLIQVIIRSALVIIGILGITLSACSASAPNGRAFLYFTIQSNITIVGIEIVFLIDAIRQLMNKPSFINQILLKIKYVFVIAIALTFLVLNILLAPSLTPAYLFSFKNFSVHTIVPVLAIVDFFIFDKDIELKASTSLLGLAMPAYYFVFFYIGSKIGFRYIGDAKVPYFFLDYENLTWFKITDKGLGVFYWLMIMTISLCLLCLIFYLLMKLRQGGFKKKNG